MRSEDKRLLRFLNRHPSAALATVSKNNTVRCTTVFYFVDTMLNFYFATKTNSRKHHNMKINNQVALCITDQQKLQTVQVEGSAAAIRDKGELDVVTVELDSIQHKETNRINSPISKLSGDFVFYKVQPTWIRWVDYKNGWTDTNIYERRDFSYLPPESYLHG